MRGDRYQFPAGTIGYDCSGFVIRAYEEAGIDLAGQYGLYTSQMFINAPFPDIAPLAVQPGDLAVYPPPRPGAAGHIVMIHSIDVDGTVRTIESAASRGTYIGVVEWDRVIAIKRPSEAQNR